MPVLQGLWTMFYSSVKPDFKCISTHVFVYSAPFSNLIFAVAPRAAPRRAAPPPPFFSPRSPLLPLRRSNSLFSVILLLRQYAPIHQVFGRGRARIFGHYSVAFLTIPSFKQRAFAF